MTSRGGEQARGRGPWFGAIVWQETNRGRLVPGTRAKLVAGDTAADAGVVVHRLFLPHDPNPSSVASIG